MLTQQGIETAARDAKLLAGHALGLDSLALATRENDPVDAAGAARLADMIRRRMSGESVARIIGEREFYGLAFTLNSATLEPRPDTELLVDMALGALHAGGRLLDLGTGTGCIPIAVLANRPDATAVAVDLSAEALIAARANAERHGVSERIAFVQGDWFAPLVRPQAFQSASLPLAGRAGEGVAQWATDGPPPSIPPRKGEGRSTEAKLPGFDLIVSNPPYIASAVIDTLAAEVKAFDPMLALDGGPDGLAPYRIIAAQAGAHLKPEGQVMVEIGYDQGEAVAAMLGGAGFSMVRVHKDLNGLDRVVSGHHLRG